ncbi:MAG: glycosyltransferase [Bacilli bacterium]
MMLKKLMFVGALPTKKYYFDGERNKSRDVLNALKGKYGPKQTVINLSLNQYFQVLKMIILSIFIKYDFIFISKCLVGGSKAIRYLMKLANRHNKKRVIFYLIGNGASGFEDVVIHYEYIKKVEYCIVESPLVKEELIESKILPGERITIVPCIKPNYTLQPTKKKYPAKTLKLIFFSRITELKGIMDAITAISNVNEKNQRILFTLDIAGGAEFTEDEQAFLQNVIKISTEKEYINYLGLTLRIENENSYRRLQDYDLHIFPSKFFQECAPGSVIDMFIAGIPTLSSTFPSAHFLMDDSDSFFFQMNDVEDLEKKLMHIYQNQDLLNSKRMNSYKNAALYNEQHFLDEIAQILERDGFRNER